MSMNKSARKKIGEEAVKYINNYLFDAGWELSNYFMFIDPITQVMYTADVAFIVQLNRDVNPTK